jgi:hypothetical protein
VKHSFPLLIYCIVMVAPASAADIVWVSFHSADNMPGSGAAGVGFTMAPDIGYTNLLRDSGHTVTRIATVNDPPSQTVLAQLNAADLVIIGRSADSAHYREDPETLFWNSSVTAPLMIMSAYLTRGGSNAANARLGWFTGDAVPDITGTRRALAVQPAHPVFDGIALDANNETGDILAVVTSPINGATQRGTSIPNSPITAGGTLIASIAGGSPGSTGTMVAEWDAGTPTDPQAGTDVFGGKRMAFMSGSREVDGVSSQTAGIFDLTPLGQQLFLNAVDYMGGPGVPIIPGDTDGDSVVEFEDFEPIRANFRETVASRSEGDLVRNGVVDFDDFRQWKTAFTGAGGSLAGIDLGFGANVPEPSSVALALVVLLGLMSTFARRRLG